MNKFCFCVLMLATTVGAVAQENEKESKISVPDTGKLQRTLKLTLSGGKVDASQTWTVETSGKWSVTASGTNTQAKSGSGYLSAAQLKALTKDLEDFRMLELPRDVSVRTKQPAQLYTLTFGFFTSTYELADGTTLATAKPARNDPLALPANRFAAIVLAIQNHLK